MSDMPANGPSAPGPSVGPDAALAALAHWLKPMASLALRAGLNHAQFDEMLRMALVDSAKRDVHNVSQLSVATGLHRKEVMRLQGLLEARAKGVVREPKKRPWASQLVLKWADWVSREPHLGVLPLLCDDAAVPCFAKLARSVTTDVHPRAVLQELLRLGLVTESGDRVSLLSAQFVPKGSADDALAVLADNVADHLQTGLHNIASDLAAHKGETAAHKRLEQALWAEGISPEDAAKLDEAAREAWATAYRQLYKQLLDTPEAAPGAPRQRVRVGMYVAVSTMEPGPMPAAQTSLKGAARQKEQPTPKIPAKTRGGRKP